MRDDDDGLPVRLHGAHDGEQLFRLLRGEHRRGLVEDEDVRAAVEHFDDLHRLLFRNGHIVDLLFGVDLEAVLFGDRLDFLVDAGKAASLGAEHDVLGGGEDVDELEVLVHHADLVAEGVLRGGDARLFPVHEDAPFVGVVDARDHVHERRLAAAVLAEQRQNFALSEGEVDVLVRRDRAEVLADIL